MSTTVGEASCSASERTELNSDGCSTRKPRIPNASARRTKSGLSNPVPVIRPNLAICFHRILPRPPSRKNRFTVAVRSRLAVSSSWTLIRNPPSPLRVMTRPSGSASSPATPPGMAPPTAGWPSGMMTLLGFRDVVHGDFRGQGVDVDDPPISPGIPRSRVVFDEIKTDADHEVRFVQARELVIPREHPDRQEIHRGRPRYRPFPHECMSDGDVEIFSEPTQFIRCSAPDHAVPREHDRPLGLLNQIGCLVEARSIRRWIPDALDGQRSRVPARLFIRDVFGQFDVGRARLLCLGQLERLPNDFRNRVRAFNSGIPLCDGIKQLKDVHELMGFPV